MTELPNGLEICRRWFTPAVLFLVFFCVGWDGFLLFWYGIAFKTGAPLIMVLFPLLHVAVGVALTYATVATLLNTTRIRLTWNVLSIAHSPIPWPGNRIIPREDIDQLYCRQVISRGRRSGPSITYEVWLSRKSGGARKLLGAALDEQQALYVEQRIERALGLTDRAMAGEMER